MRHKQIIVLPSAPRTCRSGLKLGSRRPAPGSAAKPKPPSQ